MEFAHDVSNYDELNNPITHIYDVMGAEAARLELTYKQGVPGGTSTSTSTAEWTGFPVKEEADLEEARELLRTNIRRRSGDKKS